MDTQRTCPSCGKPLAADAPQGICPECLMKAGFGTASGSEGGGDAGFVPPPVEAIARLFPQLEILELIGRGGMGAVYKARQPGLDRLVALKILPPRAGSDPGFAERFTREARALARLSHPNIVGVYDFGQVSGAGVSPASPAGVPPAPGSGGPPPTISLHYFLMEYVDGPNLRQVERAGKLAPPQALQIIPQICEALQYAHDEGIVHRDIKPENVLLDKKGRVKIADFGLAKILGREPQDFRLTGADQLMGTPHYMAPEQVEHPQEVDHRADIYSLGVVFYEMLTGELPLGKFAPPSRKVQVDVRLDEVVMHALENEPERRYQHASQIKSDVETITAHPGQAAPPVAPARGRDYRTRQTLFGLPLMHVAWGIDLGTGRPRIAKGILAVGPAAFGVIAVGFSAWGLFPCGFVAGGFWPVGLFAVGFEAVGLVAAGVQATGLLALAFWHAVGLVAASPSPIGLVRIAVEKLIVGLLFVLAALAACLMHRLIRAIGCAAVLPVGMTEGKGMEGASSTGRASAAKPYWFWLLSAAPVLAVLVFVLARNYSVIGGALVPTEKVDQYNAITAELEHLQRQERKLLQQYTLSHPMVEATRGKIDGMKEQQAELENQFPALRHSKMPSRGLTFVKVFNPPDKPISGELTAVEDNAWAVSCTSTQTYRLFELPNPGVENCTVIYRAKLKSEGLFGRAYLEMWCQVPGLGESFSRGLGNTISGSSDWATCQTPFFLKAGEKPDLIRLNLVVEGRGKVLIKDVELMASPSK
jgi:Protein kinase domain